MPINQNNNSGLPESNALDAAYLSNPTLADSGRSTVAAAGGSNPAGSGYSPSADADLSTGFAGESASSGSNLNVQLVTDFFNRAGQWIRENPAGAISAAAGIVSTVFAILAFSQSSRRKNGELNRYPSGKTYGNSYGNESVTYNPLTQTESINRGGNYTSSGSDAYTGL